MKTYGYAGMLRVSLLAVAEKISVLIFFNEYGRTPQEPLHTRRFGFVR